MESKARAKRTNKIASTRATKASERIYIDTSGPYPRSLGGNKYWFKIVDDYSRKNWNHFMKHKSDVPTIVEKFIIKMKAKGKMIEFIRCDNAG